MHIFQSIYKNLFHPIIGEIWCLHRVLPERSIFQENQDLEITPDFLRKKILEYQLRGYTFVDIDSFVQTSSLFTLQYKKKLICITFDDGFRDIYQYAYPIFLELNIPFTIYVATDMLDGKADLWWLQLEQWANKDTEKFSKAYKQIYSSSQNMPDIMHQITHTKVDTSLSYQHSLSWQQLIEMEQSRLCIIGAHSVSHPGLTKIPVDAARKEIIQSKKRIEAILKHPIFHFSYPHSMYNEELNHFLWEVGFHSAVLGFGGKTRQYYKQHLFYREYILQK